MPSSGTEFLTLLWNRPVSPIRLCVLCLLSNTRRSAPWLETPYYFYNRKFFDAFVCEYSATHGGFPSAPTPTLKQLGTRSCGCSMYRFGILYLLYFFRTSVWCWQRRYLIKSSVPLPLCRLNNSAQAYSIHGLLLSGLLMTLLDFVIDPTTLQGDRWFLGQVYTYPHHGFFFGVTGGQLCRLVFCWHEYSVDLSTILRFAPWCQAEWRPLPKLWLPGVFFLYSSVFLFMFGVIIYLNDWPLALASFALIGIT